LAEAFHHIDVLIRRHRNPCKIGLPQDVSVTLMLSNATRFVTVSLANSTDNWSQGQICRRREHSSPPQRLRISGNLTGTERSAAANRPIMLKPMISSCRVWSGSVYSVE